MSISRSRRLGLIRGYWHWHGSSRRVRVGSSQYLDARLRHKQGMLYPYFYQRQATNGGNFSLTYRIEQSTCHRPLHSSTHPASTPREASPV